MTPHDEKVESCWTLAGVIAMLMLAASVSTWLVAWAEYIGRMVPS